MVKSMKTYPRFWELERLAGVTWQDLVELEPRLGDLLWRARQAGARCLCWADVDRVFPHLRSALLDLVGNAERHPRHPVLGSTEAYHIVYWKLYDAVAGLLPSHAAGTVEAPERQRGEPVGESCPTEAATTSTKRV
jgi:hypothetical protein